MSSQSRRRSSSISSSYISGMSSPDTALTGSSTTSTSILAPTKMMKIAVAGTNGFAQYLAYCIKHLTPYQFIIVSRRPQPEFEKKGWQVVVITTYSDVRQLAYLLVGVDVIISTVAGEEQLQLIDAAEAAQVPRFVPSEFSGLPYPGREHCPSDNERGTALLKLEKLKARNVMNYTIFSCGLFYEHFAPGGLQSSQINISHTLGGEGSFLLDVRRGRATLPYQAASTYVAMTSARDAAQFVVASLAVQPWPDTFTFCAERMRLIDLMGVCARVRGVQFSCFQYDNASMFAQWRGASGVQERTLCSRLIAIAEGRFDIGTTNLNAIVNVQCEPFEQWLRRVWAGVP